VLGLGLLVLPASLDVVALLSTWLRFRSCRLYSDETSFLCGPQLDDDVEEEEEEEKGGEDDGESEEQADGKEAKRERSKKQSKKKGKDAAAAPKKDVTKHYTGVGIKVRFLLLPLAAMIVSSGF
jgi:hypothetical protein